MAQNFQKIAGLIDLHPYVLWSAANVLSPFAINYYCASKLSVEAASQPHKIRVRGPTPDTVSNQRNHAHRFNNGNLLSPTLKKCFDIQPHISVDDLKGTHENTGSERIYHSPHA